jgi:hypothetical protein
MAICPEEQLPAVQPHATEFTSGEVCYRHLPLCVQDLHPADRAWN